MAKDRTYRTSRLPLLMDEDDDPASGVANLFDVAMVLAVSLMVAMISFMKMNDFFTEDSMTIVKNPGKRNMEIIRKEGKKIEKYTPSDVSGGSQGTGKRIGTAYQLENGEIIYIPE